MKKELSIIGLGKMGQAIATTLAKSSYTIFGYDIAFEKMSSKTQKKLSNSITIEKNITKLLEYNVPILLAVKPFQIEKVTSQIEDNRLIISIAAGSNTSDIQKFRKIKGPIIRVMPNTPLLVKEGMSIVFANDLCKEEDKEFVTSIFSTLGEIDFIEDESKMHAITALSGSGPAFVELFLQSLEDAGVFQGLSRDLARKLVLQTTKGTISLINKSKKAPQELIHDVTSPGGTTITGLMALKQNQFEFAIQEAIKQATFKSKELS